MRAPVNPSACLDPNPRANLFARRTHFATPPENIGHQASEVPRCRDLVHVSADQVRGSIKPHFFPRQEEDFHSLTPGTIGDPEIQATKCCNIGQYA